MANPPISSPLPADLPTNWVYGQTVAPNGSDAGLSEKHGYNYQSQQINAAQTAINTINNAFSGLATTADFNQSAPLDSPSFTGTPTAPTAEPGTNTTQIATTAFVSNRVSTAIRETYMDGMYIGTGTYGYNAKNTLFFKNYPVGVFLIAPDGKTTILIPHLGITSNSISSDSWYSQECEITGTSYSGYTVSWWNTSGAANQFNESGSHYKFKAWS